jgi:CubicO group peptidase (beta-lactamase class C family)
MNADMKNQKVKLLITTVLFFLFVFYFLDLSKFNESLADPVASPAKISDAISFPIKSAPGLFVNDWPVFSVAYPDNWLEKPLPKFIFAAASPEGFPEIRIAVIPNMNMPLEYAADFCSSEINKIGRDVRLIYNEKTKSEDGDLAQEVGFEFIENSGQKVNARILVVQKEDLWLIIAVRNNKGSIDEGLRKILYSLKIKPEDKSGISYKYKVPEQTNDGWQTDHILKVNFNEKKLSDFVNKINNGTFPNIHSVLIIKNGKLVLEEYFPGKEFERGYVNFTRDALHGVMSVTKSITSTLIGIAIDKKMIKDTDEELISFFPEHKDKLKANKTDGIKLSYVLSMTAGFDWDEWTYLYNDPRNSLWITCEREKKNIVGYILNRPLIDQPGSKFTYNSGLSLLLGVIIEKRSSMKIIDFAQQFLFTPLGISKYEWWDKGKVTRTDAGLSLRPRDMAKFGLLFVNKGKWDGKQIVSSKWIEEATTEQIKVFPGMPIGYGYQWWLNNFNLNNKIINSYVADGYGGQRIYVFPDLEMVVVFTAGNYSMPGMMVINMMNNIVNNYILPAIQEANKN